MNETEWFHDREVDEAHERCYWRRVGFGLFIVIALAFIFAPLYGCATEPPKSGPRMEVCEVQVLGQSDAGLPVVAMACESPEEFQKAQQ